MTMPTQHGYLVLADISGFTSFVAQTELEHAHDILGELLELVVAHLTPTLTLVEVEGDAVYACAAENSIPRGATLPELYESTYAAFKDRVEGIRRRTTCTCNACRLIPTLDLKYITTCGDYVLQKVAGSIKPVGSAVNLAHRLAKNHVAQTTGWRAYALYTDATLGHMGVQSNAMHRQVETYEHLGDITTYSYDLFSRYQTMLESRRVCISRQEADWSLTLDVPATPPVVWDWLNDPNKRTLWSKNELRPDKPGELTGIGTRNHCVHGKNTDRLQTMRDWRPFDYFTLEDCPPNSEIPEIIMTHQLVPIPEGTRLILNIKLLKPVPAPLKGALCKFMVKFAKVEETYQTLAQKIGEEKVGLIAQPEAV